MAVLNSNLPQAWTPEQYGKLIDLVLADLAVAFKVGTVTNIDSESIRFPMQTDDGTVAWYGENTTIVLADPGTDELVVVPKKIAGRRQISNEAANDTNPAAAEQLSRSLARAVGKGIDAAFFANTTTNGPSGLLSLAGVQVVDTNDAWANLDHIHDAKDAALSEGATLTHIVLARDVALKLAKAKENEGDSNKSLFDNVGDGSTLAGVKVLVSPAVPAGNAWGLDSTQIHIVQRTGTTIVKDRSAGFAEDALQVRATARIGFGFANPAGVVRLHNAA
ncbi:phage major capsid protein [Mycolicibacterium austroafricanum]|uniref:phage major capsid protein n=1 Tax=Mycolicibacterium austroafricanum TaxID=39687 RepID=UPI001CA36B14|nr:phage major capsid protein [Mycolicibacterium austroafricanum]QZT59271.1 phage major capsid protein [Mycolicibacterium austroafricanum]